MKPQLLLILLLFSAQLFSQTKITIRNPSGIKFPLEIKGKSDQDFSDQLIIETSQLINDISIPEYFRYYTITVNGQRFFMESAREYTLEIINEKQFVFHESQPGIQQAIQEVNAILQRHKVYSSGNPYDELYVFHLGRLKKKRSGLGDITSALKEIDRKFIGSVYEREIGFYVLPFRLVKSFKRDNETEYFLNLKKLLLNNGYQSVFYNEAFRFLIGYSLRQFYDLNPDSSNEEAIQESLTAFGRADKMLKTIHNDSLVTVTYLVMLNDYHRSYQADVSRINPDPFIRLSEIEQSSDSGFLRACAQTVHRYIKALAPGSDAPDFALTDFKGDTVTLKSLRGKYVYIDFWFSRCGPCIASMRELKTTYPSYGDNIVFVSINGFDDFDTAKALAETEGFIGTQLFAGKHHAILKDYNVAYYPTYFLISPLGKIVYKPIDYHRTEFDRVKSLISVN